MNHLKQFADGLEFGLRRVKREWFKTIDELGQTDARGQDGFGRLGIVSITIIFLLPSLSLFAEIAWRYFQ